MGVESIFNRFAEPEPVFRGRNCCCCWVEELGDWNSGGDLTWSIFWRFVCGDCSSEPFSEAAVPKVQFKLRLEQVLQGWSPLHWT